MKAYADIRAMKERFGVLELLQLTDAAGEDLSAEETAVIETALNDATAFMNGYIRVRHTLPLSAVPPVLTRLCCEIARFYLYKTAVTDVVKDAYDAAVKVLRDIAKGELILSDPKGTPPDQGAPLVIVGGAERLFNQNSMKGF